MMSTILSSLKYRNAKSKTAALHFLNIAYCLLLLCGMFWFMYTFSFMNEFTPCAIVFNKLNFFIMHYFSVIALCLILLDVCLTGLSPKKLITIIFSGLFFVLFPVFQNNLSFMICMSLLLAYPSKLPWKTALFTIMLSSVIALVFAGTLSLIGLITNRITFEHETLRYSLGFKNPNLYSFIASTIIAEYICWRSEKFGLADFFTSLGFAIVIFTITDGRMAFIILVMQIGLCSFCFFKNKIPNVFSRFKMLTFNTAIAIFPALLIISMAAFPVLQHISDTPYFDVANFILSGRLAFALYYYHQYGYAITPQDIEMTIAFDNTYLYLPIVYGIALTIFVAVLHVLLGRWCKSTKNYSLAIFIILFCLHSLVENTTFNLTCNFLIIAMGAAIASGTDDKQVDVD